MTSVEVPMSSAMRGMTISFVVTGRRRAAVRIWLGIHIIRLAGVVMGCSVDISVKPDVPVER